MGYQTTYKISFIDTNLQENEKNQELLEVKNSNLSEKMKEQLVNVIMNKYHTKPMNREILVEELDYDPFDSPCKWYSHEVDMLNVSAKHPNTIFVLEGYGENAGDIWRHYYCNGKMQDANARIVFDDFDERNLE